MCAVCWPGQDTSIIKQVRIPSQEKGVSRVRDKPAQHGSTVPHLPKEPGACGFHYTAGRGKESLKKIYKRKDRFKTRKNKVCDQGRRTEAGGALELVGTDFTRTRKLV